MSHIDDVNDSWREYIENLTKDHKREALARNAVIGKLQADKVALWEMLERTREYISGEDYYPAGLLNRIESLLSRMKE